MALQCLDRKVAPEISATTLGRASCSSACSVPETAKTGSASGVYLALELAGSAINLRPWQKPGLPPFIKKMAVIIPCAADAPA
jgi:hypothetical protein